MTQLRSIADKKVWQMMNINHYTHICILGILMIIAQFIFPGMLDSTTGEADGIGFILYNFIALAMTIVSGLYGWYVCSRTVNQGERNQNL